MKRAILNIADVGALESTALMLEAVGWECSRPDSYLLAQLRGVAAAPIFSVEELVREWGYPQPRVDRLATPEDLDRCDLLVDVKAHVNHDPFVRRWPRLAGKILWCCLNGGDPMARPDPRWKFPPCPVLSNNQWYGVKTRNELLNIVGEDPTDEPTPWAYLAYACVPPYARLGERRRTGIEGPPICLVHNVRNWGHGDLVEPLRRLGVRFHGVNECPDGVVAHAEAQRLLEGAVCMVHLKNGDTVGYAMVEAMTAGVPFVCHRRYVEDCRLGAVLEPDVTCLTFETAQDVEDILRKLRNPDWNRIIGEAGRRRYLELQWSAERDGPGFAEWLERMFG